MDGTRRLLEHARRAGVEHFIYPSIVGVDRIPYRYYQVKLQVEGLIATRKVPWSIIRITQFHPFVERFLRLADRLPILFIPGDFKAQPVDVEESAARLVRTVHEDPEVSSKRLLDRRC